MLENVIKTDCDPIRIGSLFLKFAYQKDMIKKILLIPTIFLPQDIQQIKAEFPEKYINLIDYWATNYCPTILHEPEEKIIHIIFYSDLPLPDIILCATKEKQPPRRSIERLIAATKLLMQNYMAEQYLDPNYPLSCQEEDLIFIDKLETYFYALEEIKPRIEQKIEYIKEIIKKNYENQLWTPFSP